MMRIIVIGICTLFFFQSCTNKTHSTSVENKLSVITDTYENHDFQYNSDSTYLLLVGDPMKTNLREVIIVKLPNDSIVFQEYLLDPKLRWIDSIHIELNRGLGISSGNNSREFSILNLKTNERKIIQNEIHQR